MVSSVAALAALLGTSAPAPQIRLVDDTVPMTQGDGSLADGQVLTPFDV